MIDENISRKERKTFKAAFLPSYDSTRKLEEKLLISISKV
jgi:hypothetical protein